jgi:membrane fusion protein (multidrug efflux system)
LLERYPDVRRSVAVPGEQISHIFEHAAQAFSRMRGRLRSAVLSGLSAAILALVALSGSAIADEVKGVATVQVQDPKRGTLPDVVYGYGTATPTSAATVTESFQRDGQVSDIFVEVGDQFKKGDRLLDFGASPAAVVAYEQAKTTKALAERSLARQQQMLKEQLTTRDQVETAQKAVSDAQLTLDMLEKIGSIKPSEILTAPFDGVVTAISVSKGDRISAGAPLMSLSRTDQVILSVGIEPSDLAKLKPDQTVNLASESPSRPPIEGKVKRIGAAIDPKTRLVPAIIEVPPGGALAGEAFKAGIKVGEFKGWIVPRDTVGIDKKGGYVFQVDEGHAKRVNVNVIASVGNSSIIDGDIDPQKQIIVSGGYQIGDGDAVRSQPAPVAQAGQDEG